MFYTNVFIFHTQVKCDQCVDSSEGFWVVLYFVAGTMGRLSDWVPGTWSQWMRIVSNSSCLISGSNLESTCTYTNSNIDSFFFDNKIKFRINLYMLQFFLSFCWVKIKCRIKFCTSFPSDLPDRNETWIPVQPEELRSLMYTPVEGEWPPFGRDAECDRIAHGLESVMQHSIAEQFLTPVDLNVFPIYGIIIEYLIDLTTIKSRLENRFYR